MGPEALQKYINPDEVIKRLAAAQGIDVLNLVRSMQEVQQEQQQAMQQQQSNAVELEQMKQAGNLINSPMLDPSKNPEAAQMAAMMQQEQMAEDEQQQLPPQV